MSRVFTLLLFGSDRRPLTLLEYYVLFFLWLNYSRIKLVLPERIELPLHGYRPRALPLDEGSILVETKGIEPFPQACKARVLPLSLSPQYYSINPWRVYQE